ncbi:MAG: hypothetical protein AB8B74_02045, partial [Crocinitomicaceae bacterium]
ILMYKLKLPNTKHTIYLPKYFLGHQDDSNSKGHGILPNFETAYFIEDIMEGKDLELNYILSKIK